MEKKEILKQQHKEYADLIGMENLMTLSHIFGGTSIYIPKEEELLRCSKHNEIFQEFDGGNTKELAKKHELSERTIYRIIEKYKEKNNLKKF